MIIRQIFTLIFLLPIFFINSVYANSFNNLTLFGHPSLEKINVKLTEKQLAWISKNKRIRVGVTIPDYPPYDITSDGQSKYYEGVSADYLNLISNSLGIKIELYTFTNRNDAIKAIKSDEIDLLTTSNKYENFYGLKLSSTYIEDIPALYTSPNLAFNETPKNIAISYDYLPTKIIIEKFPNSKITIYKSKKEAIASAIFGKSDGVVIDLLSANYLINNSFSKRLKLNSILKIDSKGASFAFNENNVILLDIFNTFLHSVPVSEKWIIKKRWNSADITPPDKYNSIEFSSKELNWISKHKQIVIGLNEFNAPNSYLDENGNFQGYIPDLLEVFKIYSDIPIKVVPIKNTISIKNQINDNKIDLGLMSNTSIINNEFILSKNVKSSEFAIVRPKKNNKFTSIYNKNIIISNNDINQKNNLKKIFINPNLSSVENYIDVMLAVSNTKNDYIAVVPIDVADYYITRYFHEELIIDQVLNKLPQNLLSFAAKKDNPEVISIINKVLFSIPQDGKQVIENRWRAHSDPGQQTWHDYKYTIFTISGATIIILFGLVLWIINIKSKTKQIIDTKRELNKQLQFIQVVIDSIPHPIYVRDTKKLLILCNNAYEKTFSEEKKNILYKTTDQGKNRVDEVDEVDKEYSYAIETGLSIHKDRKLHIDGVPIYVYHWIVPFNNYEGEISGIVGGWIDISDRVQLLSELESAKEHADKASRAKSHFLATMSHEIRTPMNAIIGLLELIIEQSKSDNFDLNLVKIAYTSAKDLQALIGDILDIAKIESGELTLNPTIVNLENVLQSTLKIFQGLANQKNLYLKLDFDQTIPKEILVDPLRLKQILSNLISNSIKFTDIGGIYIRVRKIETTNQISTINFEIEDTGTGIPKSEQDKIFSPFVQANHGNHGKGGTGLGLAICKSLCDLMNGEISIIFSNEKGTCIGFSIPLNEKLSGDSSNLQIDFTQFDKSYINRMLILIVDDNLPNRFLLSKQLTFLGHAVDSAENGIEAFNLFKENEYDLIITDCNMPELDGYSLAKKVREFEKINQLKPIIIFGNTANAQIEIKQLCLEAGMNDCLFKPITLDDLKNKFNHYFKRNINLTPPSDNYSLQLENKLIDICSGEISFLSEFINQIIESNIKDMQEIKKSFKEQNLICIKEIAHKIKGSSKIINAYDITSLCEKIEYSNSFSEIIDCLNKLEQRIKYLELTLIVLRDKLKSN